MTFAYADPPYVNQAKKHYSDDPNCAEVDHVALIQKLVAEYPDGWALSLSSPSLYDILPLCPRGVRVMPWVKPFCAFKANVNPAYAWEPVIVGGGVKGLVSSRLCATGWPKASRSKKDWLARSQKSSVTGFLTYSTCSLATL